MPLHTQLGVPVEVAKLLTFPERVTEHNITLMKQLVANGDKEYPGALVVVPGGNKKMRKALKFIKPDQASEVTKLLRIGDVVER